MQMNANAIRISKYPSSGNSYQLLLLGLGFSPYPCHSGERTEIFIQPMCYACIVILTYWTLYWVLPGTVHKVLQRKFLLC